MFNDFNLYNDEVTKILKDYEPMIINASILNRGFDEDLMQEIKIEIFRVLTKNRKK